jgi:hypothetical protein
VNNFWPWAVYVLLFLAMGGLVLGLDRVYPMLRDDPTTASPDRKDTSWSLARCQMAFWTVLVSSALFWLLAVYVFNLIGPDSAKVFTGDLDPSVVGLLGISGATGIVSGAVDAQKDSMVQAATLSAQTSASAILNTSRQIVNLLPAVAGPNKVTGAGAALAQQQMLGLREQRARHSAAMAQPLVTIKRNKREAKHTGFWSDLLVDENGNSLHRLQMVLFTLVFGGYFFFKVGHDHTVAVQLSTQALQLMGVSNLVYIGFKVPGRSPGEAAPPAPPPMGTAVQAALAGFPLNVNPGGPGPA